MQTNQSKNQQDGINNCNFEVIGNDDNIEFMDSMESMESGNNTPTKTNICINTKHVIDIANETEIKHSASDDDICRTNHQYNDENEGFPISPLSLRDAISANGPYLKNKKRSNSANIKISSNSVKYQHKYKNLKKRYSQTTSQLQNVITNIQDEAEETEEALRKEYEITILHFETKYLQEKSEKSSLQHEIEKLKQKLYIKDFELQRIKTGSGYSTGTPTHNTPSPTGKNKRKRIQSNESSQTIIYHNNDSSNDNKENDDNNTNDSSSASSLSTSSSSTGNSSSNTSNASTSSVSNISNHDDNKQVINTESQHKRNKNKNKKIPNRLNRKIARKQPKGFWEKVWNLFGPPDVMCSCSNN